MSEADHGSTHSPVLDPASPSMEVGGCWRYLPVVVPVRKGISLPPPSATFRCDPACRPGRTAFSWLYGLPFIPVRAWWGKAENSGGSLLRAPVGMLVGENVTECTADVQSVTWLYEYCLRFEFISYIELFLVI